jgi:uncharacterized membrane protein YkvA (DUF1232 family)
MDGKQQEVSSVPAALQGRGEPLEPDGAGGSGVNPELQRFWAAVRRLPSYLRFAANLAMDSQVPIGAKAAIAFGGAYTISPVDLVPGIIPIAGQLDDLIVLLLSLRMAMRTCPPEVAALHLERAGLARTDFDDDLAAAKETVLWLGAMGLRASRTLVVQGSKRVAGIWRDHVRSA